jgi:hypothetical protein
LGMAACSSAPKIISESSRMYSINAMVPVRIIPSLITFERFDNIEVVVIQVFFFLIRIHIYIII